ncbi:MAG TPA: IPT/TIG domain-containing protein [Planctomycetota bacterium]|nr:IPT/TIG domain-containing protein [Planctomycetota bacterium]
MRSSFLSRAVFRVALAAALVAAGAIGQDAQSANHRFDLVAVDGGGALMASSSKSAVLALEPTSGAFSSATTVAQIGVLSAGGVSAFDGPYVLDLSPASGDCAGGALVRIRGLNFDQGGQGAFVTVRVGDAPPFTPASVSDHEIYIVTPPGSAGPADVVVTTLFGSMTLPGAFEYSCPSGPPVAVFSVAPAVGDIDGGTVVTLTGLSFLPGSTVMFDGTPAIDVVVVNSTTITCRTPAAPPGYATPSVTNELGVGSLPFAFEYKAFAKVTNLGGGCPGFFGQPQNFVGGGLPVLGGAPFQAVLANAAPLATAVLVIGDPAPGYLIPGTACTAFVNPAVFFTIEGFTSPFGTTFMSFQLPLEPALAGFPVVSQWVVLDSTGALGSFTLSNALLLRLGW